MRIVKNREMPQKNPWIQVSSLTPPKWGYNLITPVKTDATNPYMVYLYLYLPYKINNKM